MPFNILSVDMSQSATQELNKILENSDVNIFNAGNLMEALEALYVYAQNISVIIWIVNSSDGQEFEDMRILKTNDTYGSIPLIVISRFSDKKYIFEAAELGAAEFIVKPYDETVVLNKISNFLKKSNQDREIRILDEDIITFNYSEMFSKEIKGASRGQYPLSVILVKVLSDSYEENDLDSTHRVLELIKRVLNTKLRETDTSFLYGKDAVIVFLPFTDKEGSYVVQNKIEDILNSHTVIKRRSNGLAIVTASVTFPDDGRIRENLLDTLENRLQELIQERKMSQK